VRIEGKILPKKGRAVGERKRRRDENILVYNKKWENIDK
jgi:hypothetical protein